MSDDETKKLNKDSLRAEFNAFIASLSDEELLPAWNAAKKALEEEMYPASILWKDRKKYKQTMHLKCLDFTREVHGKNIKNGLTRTALRKIDYPLYKAIAVAYSRLDKIPANLLSLEKPLHEKITLEELKKTRH